jgi:putative MFS transporter
MVAIAIETLSEGMHVELSLVGLISTSFVIGMFFGTMMWGYFIDKFGRTKCYRISVVILLVCTLLMIPAFNFYVILATFLVTGNVVGSDLVSSSAIITEFLPMSKRWIITLVTMSWAAGSSLLAGAALIAAEYQFESLTTFRVCVGFLAILTIISLILRFQLDESPAYLVANGYIIRAYECLERMAKVNNLYHVFENDNPVVPTPQSAMRKF